MGLREWVGCQKRSVSTGIWAGNPTFHFRSWSSNYVRHLEWPEKLSIIYVFTSSESRAAIFFFSHLLTLQLTVLVPEDFEWKISTKLVFSVLSADTFVFCICITCQVFQCHVSYSQTQNTFPFSDYFFLFTSGSLQSCLRTDVLQWHFFPMKHFQC